MATRSDRTIPRRLTADDAGVHINFITNVELSSTGDMHVATRGRRLTQLHRTLGSSEIAGQLTRAILASLHINGGTWTSSATLAGHLAPARRFIAVMDSEYGTTDLAAATLTPDVVWDAILLSTPLGTSQRRLRTLLADCFPRLRADGGMYRDYLFARTLLVDESKLDGYAPEVADAIEDVARTHVSRWFLRHRNAVADSLGELPADWLTRPATELVGEHRFLPPSFTVTVDELAAAMVLLSLADNRGPNLSVMQSYTADSVERANDDAAFVTGVKARNREVLRTPAPAGGLFSYGGLLEFVTSATRVERHFRSHSNEFDRLLFVPTGGVTPLDTNQVNTWWRRTASERSGVGVPLPKHIEFRRLRKAALLRGKHKGNSIIGQKRSTARLYLADALPDVLLIPGLLNTQSEVSSYWRSKARTTREPRVIVSGDGPEAAAALQNADAIMDVGVAACTSNGQSPTNAAKPCGLGPVACFVCPNGYRTPETIPGLIAAVEFTDNIRKYEPVEWLESEAPILNELARKTLAQFPQQFIDTASADEIDNARALIACVYVETRTRD